MYRTGKSMNNLLSYCGLVDARIRASNKDLPVSPWKKKIFANRFTAFLPTKPHHLGGRVYTAILFLSDFANYVWSAGWTASQAKLTESTEGNHEMVQDDFWRSVKVVGFNRFLRVKMATIRRITLVMF